jgi:hypothetical protein
MPEWDTARVRTEVRNQIRMLGNAVVPEVPTKRSSHRSWMRLSPAKGQILLVQVEVPIGLDPVEWPKSGDDYVVVARESFDSLDTALDFVRERGIDTNTFDAVWKSENPLLSEGTHVGMTARIAADPVGR